MFKYNLILFIAVLLCSNQTVTSLSLSSEETFNLPSSNSSCKNLVDFYIESLIKDHRPGGGIFIEDLCDPAFITKYNESAVFSFSERLSYLKQSAKSYEISDDDGIINLVPIGLNNELFEVEIKEITINLNRPLSNIINELLMRPEIHQQLEKQGLKRAMQFGGLQSPNRGVEKQLSFTKIKLRTLLNRIAKAHGKAVWVYQEHTLNQERVFSIDFLVG